MLYVEVIREDLSGEAQVGVSGSKVSSQLLPPLAGKGVFCADIYSTCECTHIILLQKHMKLGAYSTCIVAVITQCDTEDLSIVTGNESRLRPSF